MWEELINAINVDDIGKVEELINVMTNEDLSKVHINGNTVLMYASCKGLDKICEQLIPLMTPEAINHISFNGNTALTLAASKGLDKICEQLIPLMTPEAINHVDNLGNTALTHAAYNGLEKICQQLIPLMTPEAINQVNKFGNTALTHAAKGLEKICEQLIPLMTPEAINHVNINGNTALNVGAYNGLEKVCEQLIPLMTPEAINQVNNLGNTALTHAASKGLEKVCEQLIPLMTSEAIRLTLDSDKGKSEINKDLFEKIEQMYLLRTKISVEEKPPNELVPILLSREKEALPEVKEALVTKVSNEDDPMIEKVVAVLSTILESSQKEVVAALAATQEEETAVQQVSIINDNYDQNKIEEYMKSKKTKVAITPEVITKYDATMRSLKSLFKVEDTSELTDKDQIIKQVSDLIAEGNDRLHSKQDKAILLLGDTGSGKSTLAYALSGKGLQAILDDETGELVVDAMEPIQDIVVGHQMYSETKIPNKAHVDINTDLTIGHKMFSETKVPNKYYVDKVVIWDCPGFNDTDIVQEIANSFYIKRLFETTKHVKLLLLVPESHITENKGNQFIQTLSQFMLCFNDMQEVSKSTSLVVTKVAYNKNKQHVENSISKLLNQNQRVTPEQKDFITKLQNNSLSLFHKPKDEGVILSVDELSLGLIDSSVNYLESHPSMASISVSGKAKAYSEKLLNAANYNFNKILDVVVKAIADGSGALNISLDNIFIKNYDIVKGWIPKQMYYDLNSGSNHDAGGYFLHLDHLSSLHELLGNIQVNNIADGINIVKQAIGIFAEYSDDSTELRTIVQEYGYTLLQQYEYIRFFSEVCGVELPDHKILTEILEECHLKIKENLEYQIKTMDIEIDRNDAHYFYKAIKYLDYYPDSNLCKNLKAHTYCGLASIIEKQLEDNDPNEALKYYIKAIKFNQELPQIYQKIGKLFQNKESYSKAIECYKVINNVVEIKSCFKKWLEKEPTNTDVVLKQADYFQSIGLYDKAKISYLKAFSLSDDANIKVGAWQKISDIFAGASDLGKIYSERAAEKDFFNYDMVDGNFIKSLMGEPPNLDVDISI